MSKKKSESDLEPESQQNIKLKADKELIEKANKGLDDLNNAWVSKLNALSNEQCSIYLSIMKPMLNNSFKELNKMKRVNQVNQIQYLEKFSNLVGLIRLSQYFVARISHQGNQE